VTDAHTFKKRNQQEEGKTEKQPGPYRMGVQFNPLSFQRASQKPVKAGKTDKIGKTRQRRQRPPERGGQTTQKRDGEGEGERIAAFHSIKTAGEEKRKNGRSDG